ncbi:hypothetical protein HU200_009631 [Digitaria exilis]|uniref:RNase H type-1 domain-containing protein n=1 Tax=Digitaria exilis TaxID=1010633 RepID=A0A835KQN6_9POAL|nr:hypothetical protein HU200_009631 [Digitaria exilis]
MRQHWPLPEETKLAYTGPDWLLLLLNSCSPPIRDLTKLVLWKAWSLHNDITHESESSSILGSVHSLLSMRSALDEMQQQQGVGCRDEQHCSSSDKRIRHSKGKQKGLASSWTPPVKGWTKVNVDGSFVAQTGGAGVGVVARDDQGRALFAVCQELRRCADAAEAEATACLLGVRLGAERTPGRVVLETDCARLAAALKGSSDRSELGFIIGETHEHAKMLEEWKVVQVKRESNLVADELAQLARKTELSKVWLNCAPACIANLLELDCKSDS